MVFIVLLLVLSGPLPKEKISLLKNNNWLEKNVILYEDEKYLITTPFNWMRTDNSRILFDLFRFYLKKEENTVSYFEKLEKNNDSLTLQSFSVDEGREKFILAYFLENGLCFFYDKEKKNNVKQIKVRTWSKGTHIPLAGYGGRRFYIYDNILFLETQDWIS